jgi:hypothetical protein
MENVVQTEIHDRLSYTIIRHGKGSPLFMTVINIAWEQFTTTVGISSVLKTGDQIASGLLMSVTNQQGSMRNIFPLKLKIQAVCVLFSDIVTLNALSSQIRFPLCKPLVRNPNALFF